MPIYEYDCYNCKNSFSELMSHEKMDCQIECPGCFSRDTKRIYSTFSVGGGVKNTNSVCSPSNSKFT